MMPRRRLGTIIGRARQSIAASLFYRFRRQFESASFGRRFREYHAGARNAAPTAGARAARRHLRMRRRMREFHRRR